MLKRTTDHLETFTKSVYDYPEGPEDPFAPENPETWRIVEEQQRREDKEEISWRYGHLELVRWF